MPRAQTVTGGREATGGHIPGRWAICVGEPTAPPTPGFRWAALTTLARLESGHTPSRRVPGYWDGDIPWIGIRDATENHGLVLDDTAQHVTDEGIANSSARVLPAGTVCLSRTASVGYVVMMGRPMATSQDFVNWVCGPDLEPHYLKYILIAEQDSIRRFAHGTTHQTMYYPEAKALQVCIPDVDHQRRALAVLKGLDDLIDTNRELIRELEEAAAAAFARLARTAATSGQPIGALCTVLGGSTPSTANEAYWSGGTHAWATPKDLSRLPSVALLGTERSITDAGLAQISSGLLPAGALLMSSRAPVGYLAIAEVPVAVNQGFIAMICDRSVSNYYLWQWLKANMDSVLQRANGSTFLEISKANFRPMPVDVPAPDVLEDFDRVVDPMYGAIVALEREVQDLERTRDELLPLLISGRIRADEVAS